MEKIIFRKKINDLMENDEWDRQMISEILGKKKLLNINKLRKTGLSCAAAVLIIISLWLIKGSKNEIAIEQMITVQLNGTFTNVFSSNETITNSSVMLTEINLDDDVDLLIENSLNKR